MQSSPSPPRWWRPTTLDEALRLRAEEPDLVCLAGATDLFPARAAAEAWGRPLRHDWMDLAAIPGLRGITDEGPGLRIGALTTWAMLRDAPLPGWWDAMRSAAVQVGGRQIQARGTIAGNLCNASPAADGVPPLLVLDAAVECASLRGTRHMPLADFILGNRRTALAPDEIVTAILLPRQATGARSVFLKLGARRHLVISIVMVAALIEEEAGLIRDIRLAVGACSAAPMRLPALETALRGRPLAEALIGDLPMLTPIDDMRADAAYRREVAAVLLRRALTPQKIAA